MRYEDTLTDLHRSRLTQGLPGLKERVKNLNELADQALIYAKDRPLAADDKAQHLLAEGGRAVLAALKPRLEAVGVAACGQPQIQ